MIYGFLGFGRVRITSRLVSLHGEVYWRLRRRFYLSLIFQKAVREPSTNKSKHKIEEQILMFLCYAH